MLTQRAFTKILIAPSCSCPFQFPRQIQMMSRASQTLRVGRIPREAVLAFLAAGIALFAGLAVARLGVMAVIGLVGLGIAAAAFIDLRITLLAMIPAIVLLPELPLALPLRTEDLLMVPLAAAWIGRLALGRDRFPSTPLNAPLLALIFVELIALLWGAYRGTTSLSAQLYSAGFFFLKTVEVTFLFFIVLSAVRTRRDVRVFATMLCTAAAVLGVWGVVERGQRQLGEAIVGPTGHGGYSLLGLTFVVLLATLASLFLTQRDRRVKWLLALAALPVAYSLTFTFSRQSYVGAAAAVAAIIWVRDRRLFIPAVILAMSIPLVAPEVVQERAMSIFAGTPDRGSRVSPYSTRIHAVQRRLPEVLTQSPVFGLGLAAVPPGYLDNQYLLTLYYTGVVGLAVFLWLLWRALTTAYTAYQRAGPRLKGLPLAWLAATVGLALAGLAGSPFVAIRVRQVYWVLAGLAVAAMLLARTEAKPAAEVPAEEGMGH